MNSVLEIQARPAPFTMSPATTAVLVIDMQNDFGSRGGMMDRAGLPIAGIQAATARIAQVLDAARSAGLRIVYIKMGYSPDLSDMGPPGSANRERHLAFGVGETHTFDGRSWRILVRDGWGTEVVDALKPRPGDLSMWKNRFSGFYETELHARLQDAGIRQLIFTGCTTSVCVESTLRDAYFRDYSCLLLSDCVAEPLGSDFARTNHDASLLVAEALLGWTTTSDALLAALPAAAPA